MKQRLETQLLPVRAAMYWVVNDESVSFKNIMVKETRRQEEKYVVETPASSLSRLF
jgi:hypothetical protein